MKFKFKSYSGQGKSADGEESTGQSSNPVQKRKDQIRKAQKTHRERKENYVKSLEIEVTQLRTREEKILEETRRLYAELKVLKEALVKNGIQPPQTGRRGSEGQAHNYPFDISISGNNGKAKQPKISAKRIAPSKSPDDARSTPAKDEQEVFANDTSSLPFPLVQSPTRSVLRAGPHVNISSLDLTAIGISFVLSLEEPCLPHVIPTSQASSTGHALTLSATLLHQHINLCTDVPSQLQDSSWRVPCPEIERLLELSNEVALEDDEITPVQSWDRIRKHPSIGNITLEKLEGLRAKLAKAVNCYGFGGVIKVDVFNDAIFETFVIGCVF